MYYTVVSIWFSVHALGCGCVVGVGVLCFGGLAVGDFCCCFEHGVVARDEAVEKPGYFAYGSVATYVILLYPVADW